MALALVVNAGSTSVRLSTWRDGRKLDERHLEGTGVRELPELRPDFVAHRVVHGGPKYSGPTVIDSSVEAEIERLSQLAPLHNPVALRWIRATRGRWNVPQVAVFDTAFFAELPAVARAYALPRALVDKYGLRRYGFHGLAHAAMWRAWRKVRPDLDGGGKVITLQLGGGCSAAAIDRGRPVETSMGFTPLEGLVMATRAGDVDPGLLTWLEQAEGMSPAELEHMLEQESGLRGLAGSGDMRDLAPDHPAIAVYCHRIRKYVGAYLAVLGGADGILFGGGVGEHRPDVRARVMAGMEWAGRLDVRVVAVDEAEGILEEAQHALGTK